MKKLSQYFKAGKGRGLKLVFWTTLVLSLLMGAYAYHGGMQFFKRKPITDFVDSIPILTIKDGTIQNDNLKWVSYIPMTRFPVVIDTTLDTLPLPVPDGLYVTRSAMFSVAEHGTRVDRSPLLDNQVITPSYIHQALRKFAFSFAVGIFLFFLIVSWIAYLVAVAVSALFAWIIRAKLAPHRVWRVAAFTWVIGLLTSMILAFGGFILSTWIVCFVTIVVNVIILARLKD